MEKGRRRLVACALVSLAAAGVGGACAADVDAREALVANTLARADQALIRARPTLMAGKYARMASGPYAYYRGSMAVWARDWSDASTGLSASGWALDLPLVGGVGDPHPENFGTLQDAEGTVALEVTDLDGADAVPVLWDLRRLCVGLVLFARLGNVESDAARAAASAEAASVVAEAAGAWWDAMQAPERVRVTQGGNSALLVDLFRRARRDQASRAELPELTQVVDGQRRMRRGVLDPAEPWVEHRDVPGWARAAVEDALAEHRRTLVAPPDGFPGRVKDVVRFLGRGVSSFARLRLLVLTDGPTDALEDDLLLEVKELTDTAFSHGPLPREVAGALDQRILWARGAVWSAPAADDHWGTSRLLGLPVQVRSERESHKGVNLSRVEGREGTVASLRSLGAVLGKLLALAHQGRAAASLPAANQAVAQRLVGAREAFVVEQVAVATVQADRVVADHGHLVRALERLGPTLGVDGEPTMVPTHSAEALLNPEGARP